MKKIRGRTLTVFAVAALSGGLLLYMSQKVQQAEQELARLEASYHHEQETIRVLNAEWAYLNSPARLEALARDYLNLQMPAAGQMSSQLSGLPAPVYVPVPQKKLFHNIAQGTDEPSYEQNSVVRVPPPERKPNSTKGNFSTLLNRLGKGGAP